MRVTRHARNKLRRIGKVEPSVGVAALVFALPSGETIGYDEDGNRRVRVSVEGIRLMVVVDDEQGAVVTVWME